jgi:DNA-binding MarR family transcriptional regulator/transcriptional regulator with XRE-family HTH domain
MNATDLAGALREARLARGWSQRELARRAGVHQPQVVRVERGEDCQWSMLEKLAAPLGLRLGWHRAVDGGGSDTGTWAHSRETVRAVNQAASMLDDELAAQLPHLEADEAALVPDLVVWGRAWPGVDPRLFALITMLSRLGRYVHAETERTAQTHGLLGGDIIAMGALRRMGPPYESTPTGLQRFLWITLPGLKKRLDRMEAKGMITRATNPQDRRGVVVRLTERGHATLSDLVMRPQSAVYQALIDRPAVDRALLAPLLRAVLARVEKPEGKPG